MIEIRSNGAPNVIQDLGRKGWLAQGVSGAGAMDTDACRIANALVGNSADCATIEISLFPFKARFLADATVAWTGADGGVIAGDVEHPPWWSTRVRAGEVLTMTPPRRGARAYLACAGGIDVPLVLGSRSTDLKGGFGGLEGRGLRRGDLIPVGANEEAGPRSFGVLPRERGALFDALDRGVLTLRVIAGAEYASFTDEARSAFERSDYTVTGESNRMGYRLSGAALGLHRKLELMSHGIVPGTIQVPPNGQPIVQLADANTCGGYPKIASVIDVDLWRLAQAPAGTRLRFSLVDAEAATQAMRAHVDAHRRLLADIARRLRAR